MQRNKARELLRRTQTEAIEKAHAAMTIPLVGYGLSLLAFLAVLFRVIPFELFPLVFGPALILPAALMLWAMWRVQKVIVDALGYAVAILGIHVRVVEFKHVDWRIIGSE